MSLDAAVDCDLKSEQMGRVHSKGPSSDVATQNLNGLGEMLTADTKLQSVRTFTIPNIGQGGNTSELGLEDLTFDELVKMSMDFPANTGSGALKLPSEEDFDVVDSSAKYKVSRKPYRPTHFSQNPSYQIDLPSASRGSKLFTAIERNDCKTLLQLLETNPKLGLQTGPGGRSALHVAIMQGCTELVYKLHKYQALPYEKGDYSAFEILSEEARDHSIPDASEFEILWKLARDDCMQNASALDIWSIMDANSSERSSDDYISAHPMRPLLSDEEEAEISSLRKVMSSYQERFEMDMDDVNFNFDVRSELLVHMACSRLRNIVFKKFPLKDESDSSVRGQLFEIVTFISTVLEELKDENLLQKLFKQKDARSRTILQVFVASKYPIAKENKTWVEDEFRKLLKILPSDCVNACDSVERTALHWAVAHHSYWAVKILVESGKADLCKTCKTAHYKNVTALHLAVIHDCDNCARHLLKSDCNLKQMSLWMEIDISFSSHSQKKWRPLDLAIIMARVKLARTMKQMMEYEVLYPSEKNYCLHLAAASGNIEILQLFLSKEFVGQLNSSYKSDLETDLEEYPPPLHFAVHGKFPLVNFPQNPADREVFNRLLHIRDFLSPESLFSNEENLAAKAKPQSWEYPEHYGNYTERQGCINLLLQAGADIWAKDQMGNWADPGAAASDGGRKWWYERVAKETENTRNQLNAAGTGIAVVAALVATASFVGPLQPPLGYVSMPSGSTTIDLGVQETQFMIRVFVVTNSLSFYLAIASIMLAIVPSLPIPQDGLLFGVRDELQRSRKTVSIAIAMLLASIISVLISFAASSLAVVHRQHKELTLYTTLAGGLACIVVIFFFSLRLLRLILTKNTLIINLYGTFSGH